MALKPIDTIWNGYKFRSRLEARWAVFFDALNLPYEYEREGYDLGASGYYLPDFWMPTLNYWIEIKADYPNLQERMKAGALALQSGKHVIILSGTPSVPQFHWFEGRAYGIDHSDYRGTAFFGSLEDPFSYGLSALAEMCASYLTDHLPDVPDPDGTFDTALRIHQLDCQWMRKLYPNDPREGSALTWTAHPLYWGVVDNVPALIYPEFLDRGWDHPLLIRAYNEARQARFEHQDRHF